MPAHFPPKQHFLHKPIAWTHDVWQQISLYKGNATEIQRLFNLLPAIEAYIEDTIGLQLMRNLVNDTGNILQDTFVKIQTEVWKTDKSTQQPSVLQQLFDDDAIEKKSHMIHT